MNKIKRTIAVIVPYYNGSVYIKRALDSVVAQTRQPDRIIVVDDGSIEEESAYLKKLASEYPIDIYRKENGGQGSARNFGVDKCQDTYISFLDQDDYYLPSHIEILLNALINSDETVGYAYGDLYEADGDGRILSLSILSHYSKHPKISIREMLSRDMFILPSASLIKKEVFINIGGFDEQFMGYEDDDLFIRIFMSGYQSIFVEKPVTVWCIRSGSTSYSDRMIRSKYRFISKMAMLFPEEIGVDRNYFVECIAPRFSNANINEISNISNRNLIYRKEFENLFINYCDMVIQRSPSIGRLHIKMLIAKYLVMAGQCWLLRLAIKLHGLRR